MYNYKVNRQTNGIFQGFKCDLLCWCPLSKRKRKTHHDEVTESLLYTLHTQVLEQSIFFKALVLYLLFLWTVSGLHLHLERDGLTDAHSLGQTVLIWKKSKCVYLFFYRKLSKPWWKIWGTDKLKAAAYWWLYRWRFLKRKDKSLWKNQPWWSPKKNLL